MDRLLLVRHATSPGTRRAIFPATTGARASDPCEPLDRAGEEQAARLGAVLPASDHCWASFAVRALQTARLAGLDPEPLAALAECDFGRWAGMAPAEVEDADAMMGWYADPDTAPHGGERFVDVRQRAATVLLRARETGGTVIAFTHGGLIKAALVEALGLGSGAVWRLDAAPASVTEVHPAGGEWRVVRVNWTPGTLG
ncbi:MAG: histidine phosphatase family protein [Egibacteraceae bacterium]